MKITMLDREVWYGPAVSEGTKLPFGKDDDFSFTLQPAYTNNQYAPLLLSNKGRYIWGEDGFNVKASRGVIEITSKARPAELYEGYTDLKGAFRAASEAHFKADGKLPPEEFFTKPQYNTWIELIYNQNQKDITEYCRHIVENDMPKGVIMIDDLWTPYYGSWEFDRVKFPDPKGMIDTLHEWGFRVMLWICPFVSPDSFEFRYLRDKGGLVRRPDGKVRIVEWWNGFSGVLDLSNPVDIEWFKGKCDHLTRDYGVDGFKLDAGDAYFYREDDKTYGNVTPNEQCRLWADIGLSYAYNEYRACYRNAGRPLVQRLQDKNHSWTGHGINELVPNMLTQGILGFSFGCPDMVGGGAYSDFLPGSTKFEQELFVRYCAAAALMPMIQFSAAPWRVLDEEHYAMIQSLMKTREEFLPVIVDLAKNAAKTGEPIVRYMEYVFPGEGFEKLTDQFCLGDDIIVAPVLEKGADKRKVALPKGEWKDHRTGKTYEGGQTIEVDAPINTLPILEKVR